MTTGKVSRLFATLACTLVCLSSASLVAQSSSPRAPRIVEAVDESRLTALKGDTRPEARAENDRGRVSPNLVMGDLILVLRRSPEQQAAFEAFLEALQNPASPQFHHWLTPTQVGEQYGPAPADITSVTNFLQNHGFTVSEVSKDRLTITFSGTASQVEAAFHTEIHNLQVNGEGHIANMSDPKIPEALTPVVVGVKALHNFFPRPQHKTGSLVRRNSDGTWDRIGTPAATPQAKSVPAAPNAKLIAPQFDGGSGIEDVSPYDFATIYNVLPLWTASTPIDGTGQTIAIAGTSKIIPSDVATFRSAFGLPVIASFSQIVANGTDPGVCTGTTGNCTADDEFENTLDVEWSSAVAKGAGVVLVVSGANSATTDTVFSSSSYIINHATAPVMSVSYGECELALGTSGNAAYNTLWSTAYAAGIAVFTSSGDQGSAVCDAGGSSNGTNVPYGAQYGLSVSGLTSTPYNTSVGGTDFAWGWVTNGQTTYWNTTSDSHLSNAKGYIPEFPWNGTCSNPLYVANVNSQLKTNLTAGEVCDQIAQGQITSSGGSLLGLVDTVGGSGGKSTCTTNSTTATSTTIDPTSCSGGYAKPTWQAGVTGIPADGKRDVPDVSFFASSGFSGSAYIVCVTNGSGNSCTFTPGTEPTGQEVGGTSVSSPAMAGVMALINQKTGSVQGNPNVQLYSIAAKETYSGCTSEATGSSCVFNDVDTGTIAMPCIVPSTDCTGTGQSGDQFGILNGYAATAGYDLASGLGSMNVANLVSAYAAAVAPAVTLSPTSLTFAGTLVGVSATPQVITLKNTGTDTLKNVAVTVTGANASSFSQTNTCGTSVAGGASCAITVTFKPTATGSLTASISIADNAANTPQTVALTGTGAVPAPAVTLSATTLTFPNTVIGTTAPTQTVTITNTGSAPLVITSSAIANGQTGQNYTETGTCGTVVVGGTCVTTVTFQPTTFGTLTATLTFTDNASPTTQVVNLTGVGIEAGSYTLAGTAVTVAPGASGTSTVSATGTGGYNGSPITLSGCVNATAPSGAVDIPTCAVTTASVTTGTNATTGTLTFTTTAAGGAGAVASLTKPHNSRPWAGAGGIAVAGLFLLFGIPARNRKWRSMLGVFLCMAALGVLSGCGGSSTPKNPGTTAGAYTYTVTGTDAAGVKQTATITVNVS